MGLVLQDDDILASLKRVDRRPYGAYSQTGDWIVAAGEGTHRLNMMVGIHESLHAGLNRMSSYGALLGVLALLANKPDVDGRLERLVELVNVSRLTHETFATYQAATVCGVDDATLKAAYPGYEAYLDLGRRIAPRLNDLSPLKLLASTTAALFAMQGPVAERVAVIGLDGVSPETLGADLLPDTRFHKLMTALSADDWDEIVEESLVHASDSFQKRVSLRPNTNADRFHHEARQ